MGEKSLAIRSVVEVGEWLYLKNFTREDGLDPMFQGPYKVLDFKHPNVKIEREKGKTSWVYLDHCKLVHREMIEHSIPRVMEATNGDDRELELEYQGDPMVTEQEDVEKGIKEQGLLRRSTRPKMRPERLDL